MSANNKILKSEQFIGIRVVEIVNFEMLAIGVFSVAIVITDQLVRDTAT